MPAAASATGNRRPPALAWWCAIALYAALTIAGIARASAPLSIAAIVVLVAVVTWPALATRGRVVVAVTGAAALTLAWRWPTLAEAALDLLPIAVNAALALVFGASLRRGREPLIARIIAVIEGRDRLGDAGVAGYARALTATWAALLALQAALLAAIWLALHVNAITATLRLSTAASHALGGYARLGSYATMALFFVLEYAWRRWHLRHVPQLGLLRFVTRLVRAWPEIVRAGNRR